MLQDRGQPLASRGGHAALCSARPAHRHHWSLWLLGARRLIPLRRSFSGRGAIDDNANLETIPKISSSGAENRCAGFAIATLLEAKRSAAQNGAIHGPLSYLPHPLHPVDSGWPPIVSAVIHHASFERNVTRRDSLPPRGAVPATFASAQKN